MLERAILQLRDKCRFLVLVLLALLLPFTVAKGEEKVTGPEAESVRQTITGYILSDIKLHPTAIPLRFIAAGELGR